MALARRWAPRRRVRSACSSTDSETEPARSRPTDAALVGPHDHQVGLAAEVDETLLGQQARQRLDGDVHVGVVLPEAGEGLGERDCVRLGVLAQAADHGRTHQGRPHVVDVVDDLQRQTSQAGLTEGERQNGHRLLRGVGRDQDAAVDESGVVAGTVHDDGADGVANHGEAHGAQQVAAHRTASPRPEHEQVGGRGQLDEERARVDDLEDLVDRHARRGLLDHRAGAGQQLLVRVRAGGRRSSAARPCRVPARHRTPGRRR